MIDIRDDIVRLIKELRANVELLGKILYPNSILSIRSTLGREQLSRNHVEREHNFYCIASAASIIDAIADIRQQYNVDITNSHCSVFSRSYEDPYDGYPSEETIMVFSSPETDVEYHSRLLKLSDRIKIYKMELTDKERVVLYRTLLSNSQWTDLELLAETIKTDGSANDTLVTLESELALKWSIK